MLNRVIKYRILCLVAVSALLMSACVKNLDEIFNDQTMSSGGFSVAQGQQVVFAQGNVMYDFADSTWHMAEKPWMTISDYNMGQMEQYWNGDPSLYGTYFVVDMFRWGTGLGPYEFNLNNLSFHDWGDNFGDGWRTLTVDEWRYLLFKRPNATNLHAPAQVAGVNGLILLADDWENPMPLYVDPEASWYSDNSYTAAQWDTLATAGAVFLPVQGWTDPSVGRIMIHGHYGSYWTASQYPHEGGDPWAYELDFSDAWDDGFHIGEEHLGVDNEFYGCDARGGLYVRLAKNN